MTANLVGVEICSPKEDTVMSSCQIGCSCRVSASCWVMNERWAPSSNRIWPSTVVELTDTSAMAVLRRQTLV